MAHSNNISVEGVKSLVASLEKSPSCHQGSSPIYHGGHKAASKHSTPGTFGHKKNATGGKSRTIKRPSKDPYAE